MQYYIIQGKRYPIYITSQENKLTIKSFGFSDENKSYSYIAINDIHEVLKKNMFKHIKWKKFR